MRSLIEGLDTRGKILTDDAGKIKYHAQPRTKTDQSHSGRLIGRLSVNKRGFGFVSVEGMNEDIFISPKSMRTALHDDHVEVALFAHPTRRPRGGEENRVEGEIVRIVERTHATIVGTLEQTSRFFFVIPDDERFTRDVYVAREDLNGATHGDKVVVELRKWEDEQQNPEGSVIEILGRSGDVRVEVVSVARSFGLPMSFPRNVESEAAKFGATIPTGEIAKRVDLRGTICFTIDPEDARDFDDAISYQEKPDGTVQLGIHIADVSHYVREGSALDKEAFARGTSVYMVNEVIPMLPERLSNDLCSLKPDVDRLTYSVLMELDHKGKMKKYEIRKTIIHSKRRFTYEEVQKVLASGRGELRDILLPLFTLTQLLLKERRHNGSIDFETGEAKFIFGADGLPARIIKKDRLDAHRLVEECMLLANKVVAKHIGAARTDDRARPFIYRVHDVPDPSRLADLAGFVKQFGFSLDVKQGVSSRALQRLLDQVKGSEVENFINEVALRSMAKAVYSEKNIGHYGLGFTHYTHFTSPIRRYPDLVVHRLLHEYEKSIPSNRREELARGIPGICRQSSDRERLAVEAERESVKVMQVEYMKRHVGDEFEGVIGGVMEYGMFVEINDLLVEGLVPVRDLGDDYYLFDQKHHTLRGRSTARTYRLGDTVKVRVVSVNTEKREIDFAVVR